MKKSEFAHYYVFENLFTDHDEAVKFCENLFLPYEFIVKTKHYLETKNCTP